MPELPEVTNVINSLKAQIINKKITDVIVRYDKIANDNLLELIGKIVLDITRKGKYLIFHLSEDSILIVHLRMEGKFILKDNLTIDSKHQHVIISLDNKLFLFYHDTRKFGRFYIRTKDSYLTKKPLVGVAKEPFAISKEEFYEKLSKLRFPIKKALLDQSIIAGIGNIYADEILFLSQINPNKMTNMLSLLEVCSLINNSIKVLNRAIELGGTTIHSYSALGVNGSYQNELLVHTKKTCQICNSPISKTKIASRTTYYCNKCQNNPFLVAITGGVATGKTTACNFLKEKGYTVIDCDDIVFNLWKDSVLLNNFSLKEFQTNNKEELWQLITKDSKKKEKLESFIHPLVIAKINDLIYENRQEAKIIIDMPLLFEIKYQKNVDFSIVIVASEKNELERLRSRNQMPLKAAKEMLSMQLPLSVKAQLANIVINNDGTKEELKSQILKIIKEL